jgi:penicillin G amidase
MVDVATRIATRIATPISGRRVALVALAAALGSGVTACSGESEDGPGITPPGSGPGPDTETKGIEIIVDTMGVPHIYASTDEDLFYGYGYQLAKDRMLQLEMYRRSAHGVRAEILGGNYPGALVGTAVVEDRMVRTLNIPKWGLADAELMREEEPERYALVQAWVDGINKRVDEILGGDAPLPYGFGEDELDFLPGRWEPADPFLVQKMAHLALDLTLLYEVLLSLLSDLRPDAVNSIQVFKPTRAAFAVPPEDRPDDPSHALSSAAGPGTEGKLGDAKRTLPDHALDFNAWESGDYLKPSSNNWAVDGRFTDNGMPRLAGDPHLAFNTTGVMYAVHLNSKDRGGTFNTAGFAFASAPGIALGQNDKVTWSPTSAFADVMDMWQVTIEDGKALIGDEWIDVVERDEIIEIRNAGAEQFRAREVPGYGVIFPPNAAGLPIPIADQGKELMVGWTGLKARSSKWFLELNRAQSLDEFDAAALNIPEMTYNWVGADQNGITYRVGVEVPDRKNIAPGREPWKKMEGDDPLSYWTGDRLSADQLPHSRAEETGYIVTANNDPLGFTADGTPGDAPYYYGAFFDAGWRADRITNEIKRLIGAGGVTLTDMQTLQMDTRSNVADDIVPVLSEAYANVGTDDALASFRARADLDQLVAVIADWDRTMDLDSSGALAFHAFMHHAAIEVMEDDVSGIFYQEISKVGTIFAFKFATMALLGRYPDGDNIIQGGRDLVMLTALDKTAAYLKERFGGVDPANYTYGDMKIFALDDGYGMGVAVGEIPSHGGESSINVAQNMSFRKDLKYTDEWRSSYGSVARITSGFADDGTPETFVNFPIGNVADRSSKHFKDALNGWVGGQYQKLLFERTEIDAAAEESYTLVRD